MRTRWVLVLIIATYVALATGYAIGTPRWQNPDEPAHYNYIRHLAEGRGLPVLQMGDYDAQYLERLKAAGFPDDMPIDGVRYESYQPPLYYLLAAPVYLTTAGLGLDAQVLALRLFSVALGAILLLVTYVVARLAVGSPSRPPSIPPNPSTLLRAGFGEVSEGAIALGATAFVAFLPMHTAMTAAINNDTLAELLLSALLGLMILRLGDRVAPRRYAVLAGVLLGLALLTKVSIYQAVLLVTFVEFARWLRWRDARAAVTTAGTVLLVAALLAAPWFARNALVYGLTDLIGKGRHDAVVIGQLTTAEFVAQHGLDRLAHDFLGTSFRSFWGQFGWMGLVLDSRVYLMLLALSLTAGVGLLAFARSIAHRGSATPVALLALTILLALAAYLGYNVTLVQHQGRYLFPAIVPLGVFFALGLREAWRRRTALVAAGALALILAVRLVTGLFSSGSGAFDVALWGGGAALLGGRSLLPGERAGTLAYTACFVALALIDTWCLVGFVIPYFS